ncbi:hypothetical protein [Natrononativus amylolyticus]|uniref:hypothetical protein n=1 Tax=Natrononativus amylolyticus TaxID=2963434 RepID=UPI0020CB9259|nr:hypothetical protein [Natrononativus amylolyticus]
MYYPHGQCADCGGRLYGHIDGGYQCLNCETRYPDDEFDDGGRARTVPLAN